MKKYLLIINILISMFVLGCGQTKPRRKLPQKNIKLILSELKSTDSSIRRRAAFRLYFCKKTDFQNIESDLIYLLDDTDDFVQSMVAQALGRLGTKRAVASLMQRLEHKEGRMRINCAASLVFSGNTNPRLASFLVNEIKEKTQFIGWASYLLGRMGAAAEDSVPRLYRLMEKSTDSEIKLYTASAIWKITGDSSKVIPVLISIFRDQEVSMLLGEMGSEAKDAVPLLVNVVKTYGIEPPFNCELDIFSFPFWEHIAKAGTALWEIGAASLPYFKEMLLNDLYNIRKAAVIGIGMIGAEAESAIPELKAALKDENSEVRLEAARAIRRIENRIKGNMPDPPLRLKVNPSGFPEKIEVTVSNISPEEITLWDENWSFGYDNYTIIIQDKATEEQYFLKKKPEPSKHIPYSYIISPNNCKILEFNLNDGMWALDGYWAVPGHIFRAKKGRFIKVILEIKKTDEARIHRVFVGKVESDWVELK